MLRLFIFLLCSCLAPICSGVLAAPLMVDEQRRELAGAELAYFRDREGRLAVHEVSSPSFAEHFQRLEHSGAFGYTQDTIWLRIRLQRTKDARSAWRLEVTNPYINDLRFFSPGQSGFDEAQAGDRYPFEARQVAFHNPVFHVELPDEAPRTFYLRIQTDSSTAADLVLWSPPALREAEQLELLVFGSIIGMMMMSLVFALLNWMISRNRFLLSFAGLTAVLIVMTPVQFGLLPQLFLARSPLLADALVPWTFGLGIAAILLAFRQPLEIPENHPRIDRLVCAGALLSVLAPVSREFGLYSSVGGPLLQLLFLGGLLLNGWVSGCRWRMKRQGAAYLFAAHLVILASLLIGRLVFLGLLPIASWMAASWIPGMLAFLVLTHLGVIVEAHTSRRAWHMAENAARNAEKLAQQEQKLREEQSVFFSLVAHELRTPLGVIVAGLRNLGRQLSGSDHETHSRLARISRAADRMAELIERHLQLQRLASANFVPLRSPLSPAELASDVLVHLRDRYPRRVFELATADELPDQVEADAELVILALSNLLSNAAKYSPAGETIRLEVAADSMLRYRVVDCGPGIAPSERGRIFEIFHRVSGSGSQSGFGIGLATAQRAATVQGGTLDYADRDGGGAVFTLSLPLLVPARAAAI